MAGNLFTKHPTEVGETYGEHFRNASGFGLKMIGAGLACLVHAVLPFLFERSGSRTVEELHRRLSRRVVTADLERHPII